MLHANSRPAFAQQSWTLSLVLAAWPAPAALLPRYVHAVLICNCGIWLWCLSTHAPVGDVWVWEEIFSECSGSIAKAVHCLALPIA